MTEKGGKLTENQVAWVSYQKFVNPHSVVRDIPSDETLKILANCPNTADNTTCFKEGWCDNTNFEKCIYRTLGIQEG